MRFACQSCGKAYNLPEEKIAHKSNVKLKCRVCGAIVEVKKQGKVVAALLTDASGSPESASIARVSEAPPPFSGAPDTLSKPPTGGASLPVSDSLSPGISSGAAPSPALVAGPPPLSIPGQSSSQGGAPSTSAGPSSSAAPSSVSSGSVSSGNFPDDDEDEATAPAPPVAALQPSVSSSGAASLSAAPASEPETVATPLPTAQKTSKPEGSNITATMLVAAFITGFVIDRILIGLELL